MTVRFDRKGRLEIVPPEPIDYPAGTDPYTKTHAGAEYRRHDRRRLAELEAAKRKGRDPKEPI